MIDRSGFDFFDVKIEIHRQKTTHSEGFCVNVVNIDENVAHLAAGHRETPGPDFNSRPGCAWFSARTA
jgi:hypothetical protein